ncbi:potassium-transporting ATPase subunit F [Gloeothece verrucosa]|uniref:K+transporting ATPase F subunit n=1 Tax=Gloeothece verrucosa (strain PCC 7822) TaxID=497965 RepID=E0UCQ2_GLOV7|nr:potassium-transporting ATPase subunit F [Gloeothece verrucosa]ADN15246.1 K+transporting ATPase F subunit [Gloeothece verrucosa PCC 7822]
MKKPIFSKTKTFMKGEVNPLKFIYLPILVFSGMILSLLMAYPIYAAAEDSLTKTNSYAIGILICSTFALSVYLFWVILQPEKF